MNTATKKSWTEKDFVAGRKGIPQRESLSRRHDGQIVTPCVAVTMRGKSYFADYYFVDASVPTGMPGREYGHGCVSGDYWGMVNGLRAAGIHLA